MKKYILAAMVFSLIAAFACKKEEPAPVAAPIVSKCAKYAVNVYKDKERTAWLATLSKAEIVDLLSTEILSDNKGTVAEVAHIKLSDGKEGYLETKEGYPVLGENGPIRVKANNFQIDKDGRVWINAEYADDPNLMISRENNTWAETALLDTLKLVNFDLDRYLKKQGSSLYYETDISGPAFIMEDGQRPKVLQGFTEAANVEPVREMVQMIEVNRAYEANQKVIQSHDSMLGVLINQFAKVG